MNCQKSNLQVHFLLMRFHNYTRLDEIDNAVP